MASRSSRWRCRRRESSAVGLTVKTIGKRIAVLAMLLTGLTLGVGVGSQGPQLGPTLQPLGPSPFALPEGAIYIPSTPETVQWGSLPNDLTLPSQILDLFPDLTEGLFYPSRT